MSRMIQVRNVPDELHAALKARAALAGQSLSEYLLGQLRRVSQHPTPEELRQRLATRRPSSWSDKISNRRFAAACQPATTQPVAESARDHP